MSAKKYNYVVKDIDALQTFASNAVRVEKKPVRSMITKMLDAGVSVPGIEVLALEAEKVSKKLFGGNKEVAE